MKIFRPLNISKGCLIVFFPLFSVMATPGNTVRWSNILGAALSGIKAVSSFDCFQTPPRRLKHWSLVHDGQEKYLHKVALASFVRLDSCASFNRGTTEMDVNPKMKEVRMRKICGSRYQDHLVDSLPLRCSTCMFHRFMDYSAISLQGNRFATSSLPWTNGVSQKGASMPPRTAQAMRTRNSRFQHRSMVSL